MSKQPIVVATDFSDASLPAVAWARALGGLDGAPVHLLNVALLAEAAVRHPLFAVGADTDRLYESLHDYSTNGLEALLEKQGEAGTSELIPVTRHASFAAAGVLDYLEEVDAGLLVIGTHGRRGLRRWLMGSVTEEVLRRVRRPVLCCPLDSFSDAEDAVATQPPEFDRVLAAVDFSDASPRVVEHAARFAGILGASIEVVHAVTDPLISVRSYLPFGMVKSPPLNEITERAQEKLEEFGSLHGLDELSAEYRVGSGKPWQVVFAAAAAAGVGLIVIAKTSTLEAFFLGSVTHGVLRHSTCPVLVVPPPEPDHGGRTLVTNPEVPQPRPRWR